MATPGLPAADGYGGTRATGGVFEVDKNVGILYTIVCVGIFYLFCSETGTNPISMGTW